MWESFVVTRCRHRMKWSMEYASHGNKIKLQNRGGEQAPESVRRKQNSPWMLRKNMNGTKRRCTAWKNWKFARLTATASDDDTIPDRHKAANSPVSIVGLPMSNHMELFSVPSSWDSYTHEIRWKQMQKTFFKFTKWLCTCTSDITATVSPEMRWTKGWKSSHNKFFIQLMRRHFSTPHLHIVSMMNLTDK